jgi:hypothetical protein
MSVQRQSRKGGFPSPSAAKRLQNRGTPISRLASYASRRVAIFGLSGPGSRNERPCWRGSDESWDWTLVQCSIWRPTPNLTAETTSVTPADFTDANSSARAQVDSTICVGAGAPMQPALTPLAERNTESGLLFRRPFFAWREVPWAPVRDFVKNFTKCLPHLLCPPLVMLNASLGERCRILPDVDG